MEIQVRRGHLIGAGIFVVLIGGAVAWYALRPKPTPWLDYPTDGEALVTQFMKLIAQDTNASHNAAYKLTNLPDWRKDDERHLQEYHELHRYFALLFGNDWAEHMKVTTVEKGKTYEVAVGTERLTVDVTAQGPPAGPVTDHVGVVDIREFPLDEGPAAARMAAVEGIFGGLGGEGAKENLQIVLGGGGNFSRLSPMQLKRTLLPIALDPNTSQGRVVLHLYPVRTDPTVKASLGLIVGDQRFGQDAQRVAQELLDGTVSEEELISVGL